MPAAATDDHGLGAILAGPPSVIAQISLESEAFRIAAFTPARTVAGTTRTGSQVPTPTGVVADELRLEDV